MKHRVGYNRLGRKPAHRKALHRNMVTSLFKHERIRTTKAKAREIRRTAEKMITRAKIDSVHNRRMVGRDIKDAAILAKLFSDIAPRYVNRPGGYTRMLKIGPRQGDASEMVLLELVEDEFEAKPKKKRAASEKPAPKSRSKPAEAESEAPVDEEPVTTDDDEVAETESGESEDSQADDAGADDDDDEQDSAAEESERSEPEDSAEEKE